MLVEIRKRLMKITELKLNPKLISNLVALGYTDLTEIQEAVIQPILDDKNVLAQAQTGSGKTAAFLLPILEKIQNDRKTKALIIAPTRDLAMQIFENAVKYAKLTGVKCGNFFGGSSYSKQIKFLEAGIDVVIGTPGRLIDLANRKNLKLANIDYLVLDEADQMLDMGFIDDIRKIIKATGSLKQISLFSATMPKEIMRFVNEIMPEHETVQIESKINVNDVIDQKAYVVVSSKKPKLLLDILGDSQRTNKQAIVFTRTRHEAADIADYLASYNFKVEALHSDRSQNSRTRAMNAFRKNIVQVLVATNVAARGIDIEDLPLVINYNLPENKETYVHRIGRTGRLGKQGEAISFITKNDRYLLNDIEKLIKNKIEIIDKPEYQIHDKDAKVEIKESQPKHSKFGGGRDGKSRSAGGSHYGNRNFGSSNYSGGGRSFSRPSRSGDSFGGGDARKSGDS